MKITRKNQPALNMLYDKSLLKMKMFHKDAEMLYQMFDKFNYHWKQYADNFSKDIFIVSSAFANAADKSRNKLIHLYKDIVQNNKEDVIIEGTIVFKHGVYMLYMDIKKDSDYVNVIFYMFSKEGALLGIKFIETFEDADKCVALTWLSYLYGITDKKKAQEYVDNIYLDCISIFAFKKYADVEIKIIPSKSKTKHGEHKYINETDLKITYLDSKWFTTIVKSDGFAVSGHFRLQPCKELGCWTKKLIYINEFQKSGYTAPARKLVQSHI